MIMYSFKLLCFSLEFVYLFKLIKHKALIKLSTKSPTFKLCVVGIYFMRRCAHHFEEFTPSRSSLGGPWVTFAEQMCLDKINASEWPCGRLLVCCLNSRICPIIELILLIHRILISGIAISKGIHLFLSFS